MGLADQAVDNQKVIDSRRAAIRQERTLLSTAKRDLPRQAEVQVRATGAATGSDAEGEILTSIEGLTGSKLADSLIGNGVANILNGGTCRYRSWYGLEDQLTATGRTGLKTPRPIQLLELRETRVGTCAKLSMGSAIQRFQR